MDERPNEPAPGADFEFDALRAARNYRHALLREFSPHLRGRVLEAGSGIGQMTEQLRQLPAITHLLALEPDAAFCRQFRLAFPTQPLVEGTIASLGEAAPWNAIVSINVLEHIRDDAAELARYRQALQGAAGRLCLFVPARPEIYAPIDQDFGHHRRYTRPQLRQKLQEAGFQILRLHYFNCLGYFAWWLNFRVLQKRNFNVAAVRLFDRVIFPPVHAFETFVIRPPIGQSLLAVALAQ